MCAIFWVSNFQPSTYAEAVLFIDNHNTTDMAIVRNTVNPVIELVGRYLQTDLYCVQCTVFNIDYQVTGVSMLKNEFNEYAVYV